MSPRITNCLCSVLVLLTLSACSESPPAQQAPPPAEVTVVTLKAEPVTLTRELPGRTRAFLIAEVRPQVSGIVKARLFVEGGVVKAGQPLYQLDDSTYRADRNSARAALERARATLTTARLRAERSAEIRKIDAISAQDNDAAQAALGEAQADVASATAGLQVREVTLGYARILSPIAGRIGKSSVTQGALVTANQAEPLATVQQLDPVYVDLSQSSAELLQLRREIAAGRAQGVQDVSVKILLEDGTPYAHDGRLEFTDVTVDESTGSFALRVVVPNPENLLLPGMYVRALIGNAVRQQAVLAPQQGISHDPKGNATAMVVGADGKAAARSVKTSRTIGDQWLIDEGLAAGDRLIVEGLQKVQPGSPVKAVEASTNATAAPAAP